MASKLFTFTSHPAGMPPQDPTLQLHATRGVPAKGPCWVKEGRGETQGYGLTKVEAMPHMLVKQPGAVR